MAQVEPAPQPSHLGLPIVSKLVSGLDYGDDDSEEEEEAEVIFYSEGLSNHATSYVPSAVDTLTNRQVPFQYEQPTNHGSILQSSVDMTDDLVGGQVLKTQVCG